MPSQPAFVVAASEAGKNPKARDVGNLRRDHAGRKYLSCLLTNVRTYGTLNGLGF